MSGYECAWGEPVHLARFIFSDMTNGNTISWCDEHFPPGVIPIVAAELGVDPMELYKRIERYVNQQARQQAKATEAGAGQGVQVVAVTTPEGNDTGWSVAGDHVIDPGGNDRGPAGEGEDAE